MPRTSQYDWGQCSLVPGSCPLIGLLLNTCVTTCSMGPSSRPSAPGEDVGILACITVRCHIHPSIRLWFPDPGELDPGQDGPARHEAALRKNLRKKGTGASGRSVAPATW